MNNQRSGVRRQIAVVRDDRYFEHKTGHIHPEHPRRLQAIYRMLDTDFPGNTLIHIEPEPVPLEYLELIHTPVYIEKVLKTADHYFTSLAPDTPASAKTYLAAWLAVGGCITGLDALISGQCDVCFSLGRPPGHHALADRAGGFCIFNNLGVTARYAMKQHGFQRILIIDWDIHHGNGLHDLFYEEKEVLYFSSHDTLLYPYTGDWEETGRGQGKGYTVNLPVPRKLEDKEILYLYQKILGPVVRRYQPELILVSAGFDAHHNDPIGRSRLTEQVFGWLTCLLLDLRAEISNPPLLFTLEGGYHPRSLARSVKAVLKALTEDDHGKNFSAEKTGRVEKIIKKALKIHARHNVWTK
ncbi:histone deacetylase family protein [Desulfonema magnum]|uniref:Histone deacetylase family protein n=1 Tax=Desulfonema magnum TaxID=45655 RepID=A0A975BVG9_9BACT|nr:histone deacetylase [Desulfonema magnum]QTA92494.1 Histone deacetylase family protein [Desulfonema magnum]